ncbi:MAG TPA: regulatory iron-sulfur-containing complex subunit RicT, partial [Candidatus Latescibacteria bacterium]|nr:regulatory iron-sulfur-containing complex subunit RicT [Candidatus Latescibacterota bacterium]
LFDRSKMIFSFSAEARVDFRELVKDLVQRFRTRIELRQIGARQEARVETNLNSCTATFTQWAGLEALTGPQDESLAMIAEFKRRRSLIVDGLNRIPGFSCRKPAGAFYAFPNVTEACRMLNKSDSKALQEYLLFEAGVAVLPRTSFGRRNAGEKDEYVRFSYATSAPLIEEGLERIRKAMEG